MRARVHRGLRNCSLELPSFLFSVKVRVSAKNRATKALLQEGERDHEVQSLRRDDELRGILWPLRAFFWVEMHRLRGDYRSGDPREPA